MQLKKLFSLLAFVGLAATASAQEVTFTGVSGTHWSGAGVEKLFDNTSEKWGSGASGAYFIFQASEPVVLTGYAMRTADDASSYSARNPKSWTIYGSNDAAHHDKDDDWMQIGESIVNNTTLEAHNFQTYYFSLSDNKSLYKYYKVTIDAVQGAEGNVQLSEFIPSYTKYAEVSTLTGKGGGQWKNEEAWTNMIDGNLSTKWSCWPWDARDFIIVDAGAPIVLKRYMLSTGNDTQNYPGRNPTAWTIWGTNEENPTWDTANTTDEANAIDWASDDWTEVVNVSGQTLPETNGTATYFDVEGTPAAYRYYKFKVTNVKVWEMFQLGEIKLNPVHEHSYHAYSFSKPEENFETVSLCDVCDKAKIESNHYTFNIKDGRTFTNMIAVRDEAIKFNYERIVSSPMGTICLPYELTISGNEYNNADFYTLAKCVDNTLVFDKCTSIVPELTPAIYILKDEDGTTLNLKCDGTGTPVTPTQNVTVNDREIDGWAMVGTIKNGSANESGNSIYYVNGGGFKRCTGTINYKPYRAYITGPADATLVKGFGISDDMEDAINSIMSTENGEIQLYDLSGRKVSNIRSGEVYIMNGRKVMFNK